MDLSFSMLGRDRRRPHRQPELGQLLAGVVARQAASRTAFVQAALARVALAAQPSFNPRVAGLLTGCQGT